MREKKLSKLHPSGLTLERFNWPFQTEEERKLVGAWRRREAKKERQDKLKRFGEALL